MKEVRGICGTWEYRVMGMENKWENEIKEMKEVWEKEVLEIKEEMKRRDKGRREEESGDRRDSKTLEIEKNNKLMEVLLEEIEECKINCINKLMDVGNDTEERISKLYEELKKREEGVKTGEWRKINKEEMRGSLSSLLVGGDRD